MPFLNHNTSNNAQGQLLAGISASAGTLILQSGQGALFPSAPFRVKLEKYDTAANGYRVLKREICLVTAISSDTLTITRSYEDCPSSYSATEQTSTAFSFDSGDTVSLVLTAGHILDVQDEVARLESAKLDKSGGSMSGALQLKKSADVASAATVELWALAGNYVHVTGTSAITSFGNTAQAGAEYEIEFDSSLTLTHNATSLVIPGSANVVTASGDTCRVVHEGSGNWRVTKYQKSNGSALVGSDVTSTRSILVAGENISAGNPVYVSSADGKAYRTDTTAASKCVCAGFAANTAVLWSNVTVDTDGKNANQSGLTPGAPYFLNNSQNAVFNGAQQLDQDTTVDGYRMSSGGVNLANTECLSGFTTPGGGTITLSTVDFRCAYNTYTTGNLPFYYAQYYATLYADNGGQPGTQLAQGTTGKFDGSSADSLRSVSVSYTLQPGTKYWLGISATCGWNSGQSAQIRIKNSNVTANCDYGTRTGGVFTADNTKDLYYALSFTTASSSSGNYAKNVILNSVGGISTTPAIGLAVPVGRALSATEILIDRTECRDVTVATPTVGASPYTYQNVGDRPVNVSVTGGTVSLIQYSRDNTNFYQAAAATNAVIALAPGDYCKVTYSAAPTLKVFPL